MSTAIRGLDEITGSNDPVNISQNKLHIAQYVWDVNTLAWIRQTGASGGAGTDVVVTNFPDVQSISGTVVSPSYSKQYDEVSSSLAYLGTASAGTSNSSALWQIQKLSFTGNSVSITWADGNANFDNVWNNRASLSYS